MRRALIVLGLLPVLCAAQISTLRHDLEPLAQIKFHADELKEIVNFGYADGSRFHNFSRAMGAATANQCVQMAASRARYGTFPGDDDPASRGKWRDRFWIFKWLGETLSKELTDQGVAMSDYYAMVEEIKKGLAKAGIVVNDPFVRFSDVPQGHWADGAIHALRRAGIVTGYPDNTFRN